jgi:hypothetical protein
MDKQEFLRANRVSQMPKLVQVMAGRLYDAAFEAGRQEGYRQGVDAYIAKEAEVHKRLYDQGAQDANHWGSAAFIAAACSVMHQLAGWGGVRLKRFVDGIGEKLVGMIDPAELIKEVRGYGIRIEWDDMLAREMEEME